MTVPVYWGRPAGAIHFGDLVFDHPTPLDGADTLGRLLDSIAALDDHDFELVIIIAPVTLEIEVAAVARTRQIISACNPGVPVKLLTPAGLETAAGHLGAGAARFRDLLDLNGYAAVRNACLLGAVVTEADLALLIDDDELFHRPDFIARVRTGMAVVAAHGQTGMLAGYYVDANGGYLLNRPDPAWAAQWPKLRVMDEAFVRIIAPPPRYKRTPFAFGGNLCIPSAVFRQFPFDTTVTRGEDIDYLMMAALHGIYTLLDNELPIRHLPPPKTHPDWQQVRQDALRFARQRAKLEQAVSLGLPQPLTAADFDPYPGFFLRSDLDARVASTARALAAHCREQGDLEGAEEALRCIELFSKTVETSEEAMSRFIDQRDRWRELLTLLTGDALDGLLAEA